MNDKATGKPADSELLQEVRTLREEVQSLRQHNFLRAYDSPGRLLGFNLVRGIAFGFGSVIGATVLVSIVIFMLSSIEFIPIIGEWGKAIIDEIQQHPPTVPPLSP